MKLSISNIGWTYEYDELIYRWMKENGYSGLEIAPTRIFPESPYLRLDEARKWLEKLQSEYGLLVPSMQSIWYGKQEKIFGTPEERQALMAYTKKAIDFAQIIGCGNLVFGCPRNRSISDGVNESFGIPFFREIGDYALEHGTVVAMEANPPVYNTNYINTTEEAFKLIEEVDSAGFKLNLDVGTMIENGESVYIFEGKIDLINHVHISEPGLKPIVHRTIHNELRDFLLGEGYQKYVSIEMGKIDDVGLLKETIEYVGELYR